MIYTIKNENLIATVNSLGAELTSLIGKNNYEYIWQGEEWKKHAPVLFPICGALRDGKYTFKGREYEIGKHGFAKLMDFELKECSESVLTLVARSNDETLEVYPFEFALTARYELIENRLEVTYTVENSGMQIMPYMFGWHPAFTLAGNEPINSFTVDFGGVNELTRHTLQNGPFINPFYTTYPIDGGKYYLNEEEIYANDTMIFKDTPKSIRLVGQCGEPSLTMDFSDNLPYLCIWKYPASSARYVCLEPWSDLPSDGETEENFLSRQMSRLSPAEKEDYKYTLTLE